MFPMGFGEPVARLRRKLAEDPYSGELRPGDWANPDCVVIDGGFVAQTNSVLGSDPLRQQITTQMAFFCALDQDVKAKDRIQEADGTLWEVEGRPARWKNPFTGWEAGLVSSLQAVDD